MRESFWLVDMIDMEDWPCLVYEDEFERYEDGDRSVDVRPWHNEKAKFGHKPSIHMPRWASRIKLLVKDVRVQRLQDISDRDALAEGVFGDEVFTKDCVYPGDQIGPYECFANLWNSINGDKHPWSANPYVWVLDFERIK